jgi:hypothetical protein
LLRPNETVMIEIALRRAVDLGVFRLTDRLQPSDISSQPLLKLLPWSTDEEAARRDQFGVLADRLESTQDPDERKRIRQQLSRFVFGS